MAEIPAFEQETRERLRRMERELRCWRFGVLFGLSAVAVLVAGGMADPPAKELSVRTLRLVDQEGKDRIVLTAERGIPDMTFLDPSGKSRLTLDIADDQRPVLLISESGRESGRLTLGLEEEGVPMLQLYDGTGKKRITFGVPKNGGPVLRVLDKDEKLQIRFP
jgi:hypothetical protein